MTPPTLTTVAAPIAAHDRSGESDRTEAGPVPAVDPVALHRRRVEDGLTRVDVVLTRFFAERTAKAAPHGAAFHELWTASADGARGGKRMRPRAVLTAFHALDRAAARAPLGAVGREAEQVGAAFELLHTAFLMHDDVIDHDDTRRGAPNVAGRFADLARASGTGRRRAREYGEASAILAGDLLLTAAHRMIAGLDLPRSRRLAIVDVFDECVYLAAAGEHADVRFAVESSAGVDDVLAMIEQKTATYSFSAPLQAGAILADADPAIVGRLGDVGRDLGVAFQLRDDVLGVFGEEAETGKTVIGDLREGKQTLLVAHARSDAEWPGVADRFGRADLDDAGADELRAVLVSSGALAHVEELIEARCRSAVLAAREAGFPSVLVAELAETARACTERTR